MGDVRDLSAKRAQRDQTLKLQLVAVLNQLGGSAHERELCEWVRAVRNVEGQRAQPNLDRLIKACLRQSESPSSEDRAKPFFRLYGAESLRWYLSHAHRGPVAALDAPPAQARL